MEYMIHLFNVGGFMMYPLLLASIFVVAVAAERASLYRRSLTNLDVLEEKLPALLSGRKDREAARVCGEAGGAAGRVLEEASLNLGGVAKPSEYLSGKCTHAASELKANLNYVSAIVTLSPLMGLLGTVIGMIRSFDVLSISEGQPFAITGGVAEALVATGFGLFVAIVAMLIHVWLSQWSNKLIGQIESAASLYLASLPAK